MNLGRIVQLLFSNLLAQLVSIFMQLVVPPLFLRFYANGIEVYGEWIALSASISYLHTLNLGVQTYASNQMTILYSAGDIPAAKTVQASALRLLLLLIILFVFGGLSVLLIPVDSLLKLTGICSRRSSGSSRSRPRHWRPSCSAWRRRCADAPPRTAIRPGWWSADASSDPSGSGRRSPSAPSRGTRSRLPSDRASDSGPRTDPAAARNPSGSRRMESRSEEHTSELQ